MPLFTTINNVLSERETGETGGLGLPDNNGDILNVIELKAWYGSFLAVKDINIGISRRSVTAIIGPSGCGKSTLIRCLNRMHEVVPGGRVSGKVLLDGEDIYARGIDPVNVRRRIGMVFQKPNPFPAMSVFDNVVAGLASMTWPSVPNIVSARLHSGMRLRISSTSQEHRFLVANSSVCASPALFR
jgi:ABC-type phosphate transport system ATPase subunit